MSFFVENEVTDEKGDELPEVVLPEDLTVKKAELNAMLGEIERIRKIIDGEKQGGLIVSNEILELTSTLNDIKSRLASKTPINKERIEEMEKSVIALMNLHIEKYSELLIWCIEQDFVSGDTA